MRLIEARHLSPRDDPFDRRHELGKPQYTIPSGGNEERRTILLAFVVCGHDINKSPAIQRSTVCTGSR